MKKFMTALFANKYLLMAGFALLTFDVNAHPGHDHHHWMSGAHHSIFFLSLVIGISALLYGVIRWRQQRINSKVIQGNKKG